MQPDTRMLQGTAHLTDYGKAAVAKAMIGRGENFLGAAVLLKREGGNGYVWRYLLCQGIEVVLKGLLLLKSYNEHHPTLREIGHDLTKAADRCAEAYRLRSPAGDLRRELEGLSRLYMNHQLRYASGLDLLVDPETIPVERVMKRMVAVLRILRRSPSDS